MKGRIIQGSKWKAEFPDLLDHVETILTVSTWSNKPNKSVTCDHRSKHMFRPTIRPRVMWMHMCMAYWSVVCAALNTQNWHNLPMNWGDSPWIESNSRGWLSSHWPHPSMGVNTKKFAQGKNHRHPPHIIWSAPKGYTATCDLGVMAGSTWILNFQAMRRRYVTRRREITPIRLHYAHGPGRNRVRCSCKQVHSERRGRIATAQPLRRS